jgi:hypothetical protein
MGECKCTDRDWSQSVSIENNDFWNNLNLEINYFCMKIPGSPYGDFGRLPDSFLDGNLGIDVNMSGVQHPLQNLSMEETHHTHHSETQTSRHRRIIREIIV